MKYDIQNEEWVYRGFLKIRKAQVTFEAHEGNEITTDMECLDRGDAVAVLLYDNTNDRLIFTRQFRYPPVGKDKPWMLEVPAGSVDGDEPPQAAAYREVMEETGYAVEDLKHVYTYYASPGGSSERVFFYYGEVSAADRKHSGGGRSDEHEDIELVYLPKGEARKQLASGGLRDAKSIIALQWFFANKTH